MEISASARSFCTEGLAVENRLLLSPVAVMRGVCAPKIGFVIRPQCEVQTVAPDGGVAGGEAL
jgi:hypothetical protein